MYKEPHERIRAAAGDDYKMILNREVENFAATLIDLINKNGFEEFAKIEILSS